MFSTRVEERKTVRTQILLSCEEKSLLTHAGKLTHLSITNFIRSVALQEASKIVDKSRRSIGGSHERS